MTENYTFAILVSGLLVAGSCFSFLAAIGMLRLPDAASKAGTVGAGLILLGFAFAAPDVASAIRALLTLMFLVLTAPVAAHLLGRAAYLAHDPSARKIPETQLKSHTKSAT
jgi:multicomponent Na+:H+ antiporter subunit G